MRRFLLALVALAVAAVAGEAGAKSFRIERFHSDVLVRDDGSVRVEESLTYVFDGRFSYAYRIIPLRPGDRLSGFRVGESGRNYTEAVTEALGTFQAVRTGHQVKVTWYYHARNEQRTFRFTYEVAGLVRRFPDTAEYYQRIIGDETNVRMSEVTARVELPGGGWGREDVRVWAHGPLNARVEIESPTVVTARARPLPAREFLELRILLPSEAFAALPMASDRPRLASILEEEARWAAEANRRREVIGARHEAFQEKQRQREEWAGQWLPIAFALGGASLAVWFMIFVRFGKPHSVSPRAAPGRLPSEHPPAVVAQLLGRGAGGPVMVATLLDLAERGYLTVEETTTTRAGWFGREKEETKFRFASTGENPGVLQPFEAELLEFVFNVCGNGREFTLADVKRTARKKRAKFRRWFMKWGKSARETAKREGFFEPVSAAAVAGNLILGLAVAGVGLAMSIRSDSPAGVPALVGGFVQAVLTVTLSRRTPEGQRLMLEWKAFGKHLRRIARGSVGTRLASRDWARHVAAAIVFGMHAKVIPHLEVEGQTRAYTPVWFSSGSGGIDALTTGFGSMIDSVSSTMSSATGSGGGASAGGGGGGGGGSAGAG